MWSLLKKLVFPLTCQEHCMSRCNTTIRSVILVYIYYIYLKLLFLLYIITILFIFLALLLCHQNHSALWGKNIKLRPMPLSFARSRQLYIRSVDRSLCTCFLYRMRLRSCFRCPLWTDGSKDLAEQVQENSTLACSKCFHISVRHGPCFCAV